MAVIDTNLIRTQEGFLVEDFQDASEWTDFGSSAPGFALTDNTTDFLEGTQSLTWSGAGAGSTRYNKYDAGGLDVSLFDIFSMWVDWDRANSASSISLYISSDGDRAFTNYVIYTLALGTGSPRNTGGPINFSWDKANISSSSGTIDWSNITNINILVSAVGGAESVNIDSLRIGRKTRPKVMVTFDDGVDDSDWSQQAQAAVALSYGVPVSLFVIPELIDGVGYLEKSELTTLQSNGHLIAGHTYAKTANDYTGNDPDTGLPWTPAEVQADIESTRSYLSSNGFSKGLDFFAWPGGAYESSTEDFIPSAYGAGLKIARSIGGVVQTNNFVEKLQQGIIEPMIVNASNMNIVGAQTSLVDMQQAIDDAIDQGTTVLFYVHKISNGALSPANTEITGDDFETMMAYIQGSWRYRCCHYG
jgi:hypothetical protein